MKQNSITTKAKNGFTLIEVLIAAFLFGIVATIAVGIFSSSSTIQLSSNIARKAVQDERFSIEEIARDIRMAEGGYEFCSSTSTNSCGRPSGDFIRIYPHQNNSVPDKSVFKQYGFTGGQLVVGDQDGNFQSLFSSEFTVSRDGSNAIFSGYFPSPSSVQQPYVTIDFNIDNLNVAKKESEKVNQTLRTTVTTRAYGVVGSWQQ